MSYLLYLGSSLRAYIVRLINSNTGNSNEKAIAYNIPIKVKSGMIIIMLRKGTSRHWDHLTAREKKLKDTKE